MTSGTHPQRPEAKAAAKDRLLQTIAILGLIAVLLLGAWGIIQLAFNLPAIFSNVGGSLSGIFNRTATTTMQTREALTVSAPQTISADKPFTITWRHTGGTGQYGYTISYSCADGFSLSASLPNGTSQKVDCNTPFNFTSATQRITLTPASTAEEPLRVTFTVSAVRLSNKQVAVSGSASTTVEAKKVAATSKTNTTYYASGRTSLMYGSPDLAVYFNSVNSLSSAYGRTAVVFTIQNVGTNVAYAGWTFDAHLPTNGGYLYQSPIQQPLYPGDRIVYTLTFDRPYGYDYDDYDYEYGYPYDYAAYGGAVTIIADPYNAVLETNEANNTASAY